MRLLSWCLLIYWSISWVEATIIVVDNNNTCSCIANVCGCISAALLLAQDNDIISISPGTYTGVNNTNLCVSAPCTFRSVILEGNGTGVEIVASSVAIGLNITANSFSSVKNISFSGFEIPTPSKAEILSVKSVDFAAGAALQIYSSTVSLLSVSIRNSRALHGGAMVIVDSDVIIDGCNLTNNTALLSGGAIAVRNSNLSISDSLFKGNNASSYLPSTASTGGAISFWGAQNHDLNIANTQFVANVGYGRGGAIEVQPHGPSSSVGSISISNCKFTNNTISGVNQCSVTSSCTFEGGAIFMNTGNASISDCEFQDNKIMVTQVDFAGYGGAIYVTDAYLSKAQLVIQTSRFVNNSAIGSGGAVFAQNINVFITDTTFVANIVSPTNRAFTDGPSLGGAIRFNGGGFTLVLESDKFEFNAAISGWGGALYVSDSAVIKARHVNFTSNTAISSYTSAAQGGAIMSSTYSSLEFTNCVFLGNTALSQFSNNPLTYSGEGGAIYAQSSVFTMNNSIFVRNAALAGQFDVGSSGGAIVIEDCNPAILFNNSFVGNSAVGYFGQTAYAGSGSGGALYLKFSAAEVSQCRFFGNWVSASPATYSIGGAIAIFFDYSDVSSTQAGVQINDSWFENNAAYASLCSKYQSGLGGAIGVVGTSTPPVVLSNNTFLGNAAVRVDESQPSSAGGALMLTASSTVYGTGCRFENNTAVGGLGGDVASIVGESGDTNTLLFDHSSFLAKNQSMEDMIDTYKMVITLDICQIVNALVDTLISRFDSSTPSSRSYSAQSMNYQQQRSLEIHLFDEVFQFKASEQRQAMNSSTAAFTYDQLLDRVLTEFDRLHPDSQSWNSIRRSLAELKPRGFSRLRTRRSLSSSGNRDNAFFNQIIGSPNQVLSGGMADYLNVTFYGRYHVLVGSVKEYVQLIEDDTAPDNSAKQVVHFVGTMSTEDLSLTVIKSNLLIQTVQANAIFRLSSLNIFNSTLNFTASILVTNLSFIYNCAFIGLLETNATQLPSINFTSDVVAGFSFYEAFTTRHPELYTFYQLLATNATMPIPTRSTLNFQSCRIIISGALLFNSPSYSKSFIYNATDYRNFVYISKDASIEVMEGGLMALFCSVHIESDNGSLIALYNAGNITLEGIPARPIDVYSGTYHSILASSLGSLLTVRGPFVQTPSGSLMLYLNQTSQSVAPINLVNDHQMQGQLAINFYSDADLVLYDTDYPSNFSLINLEESSLQYTYSLAAPVGLGFNMSQAYRSQINSYQQVITLRSMACESIAQYYEGITSPPNMYLCSICLMNSSCEMCANGNCTVQGGCANYGGTQYSSTCCASSCNPPYGHCEPSDNFASFSCYCTGWFYKGHDCRTLSPLAIVTIFSCVFIVVMLIIATAIYHRSRRQKRRVLEELREGILRHTESANDEYILNMQQALILNDVFVKFDEIKLESKVGEGSFGVVHKASFRGAQVAVKQMRSVFFELTEKEIEEFRKEAYMMSRLRHPNIVLVMGISLLDPEPAPLPKTRSLNMVDDADVALAEKKKPGPQQKTVCIITEFLDQGSLADILYGPTRLPADVWSYELILTCALQAARGMLYLHSHHPPICHRDLKSSNLVVDDHWVVKVTDFGMSRIVPEKVQEMEKGLMEDDRASLGRDSIGELDVATGSITLPVNPTPSFFGRGSAYAPEMTSNMGTTAWCAPEVLTASNRTRYSVKVDVYSFGMVLWELWEKKRPFEEYVSRFDIMDAIRAGKRPAMSESCPPTFAALIKRCWQTEPSRRPMFNYIVRYLKDELARVKRQKSIAASRSPALIPGDGPTSPNQLLTSLTSAHSIIYPPTGQRGTDSANNLRSSRDSFGNVTTMISSSSSHDLLPSDTCNVLHSRHNGHGEGSNSATQLPESRAALVKAASDRSLAQLVENPALPSPVLVGYQSHPAVTSNLHSTANPTAANRMPMPVPSPSQQLPPPRHKNWRDKYVLRASGWSQTNPDAGLPPQLAVASSSKSATMAVSAKAASSLQSVPDVDDKADVESQDTSESRDEGR